MIGKRREKNLESSSSRKKTTLDHREWRVRKFQPQSCRIITLSIASINSTQVYPSICLSVYLSIYGNWWNAYGRTDGRNGKSQMWRNFLVLFFSSFLFYRSAFLADLQSSVPMAGPDRLASLYESLDQISRATHLLPYHLVGFGPIEKSIEYTYLPIKKCDTLLKRHKAGKIFLSSCARMGRISQHRMGLEQQQQQQLRSSAVN